MDLQAPPGTSELTMHRDNRVDPPELVCQVGATKLEPPARQPHPSTQIPHGGRSGRQPVGIITKRKSSVSGVER